MQLRSIFILISIALIFTLNSCKKKSGTSEPPNTPEVDNKIYGELMVMKREICNGATFTPNYPINTARFDWDGFDYGISGGFTSAGIVSLGAVTFSVVWNYYQDTTTTFISPYYWNVTGYGGMPAFSHTIAGTPQSIISPDLPDTIFISQNNTIKLNGINNANEVEVIFSCGIGSFGWYPSTSEDSIVTSPPYYLGTGGSGTISVTAYQNSEATFGNKKFRFKIAHRVEKTNVYFKP